MKLFPAALVNHPAYPDNLFANVAVRGVIAAISRVVMKLVLSSALTDAAARMPTMKTRNASLVTLSVCFMLNWTVKLQGRSRRLQWRRPAAVCCSAWFKLGVAALLIGGSVVIRFCTPWNKARRNE